jgi:hypothetical protein
MIDCVNLKCCEDNFTKTMIPTITNSCVLLRPDQTQSQQREQREEQREQREERKEEGGGVHEEIARPDGVLNCARVPIPFT